MVLVFRADGTATAPGKEGDSQITLKIDPTKKPKTLNFVHATGELKGKTQYLIYQLTGDTLTILGSGAKEEERPRDFTDFTKGKLLIFSRLPTQNKP